MKKHLGLALGVAVMSAPAFATKARLHALTATSEGSFVGSRYISDTRNVFFNPAYVNDFKDYVVFEWGEDDGTVDSVAAPNAEGGFFRGTGNFVYGLYLGREQAHLNENRVVGGAQATDVTGSNQNFTVAYDHPVEIYFGGDMGLKWGVSAYFTSGSNKNTTDTLELAAGNTVQIDADQTSYGLNFGVAHNNFQVYANLDMVDESEGGVGSDSFGNTGSNYKGEKFESDFSWRLGASYALRNYTVYAEYFSYGFEFTKPETLTTSVVREDEDREWRLGVGGTHKLNKMATMFTDIHFEEEDHDAKWTGGARRDSYFWQVPVTVGVEAEATEWLALRGSIRMPLFDYNRTAGSIGNVSLANQTTVAAGASLKFGKLMIDGLIATDVADNAGNTTVTDTNDGVLSLDHLMSRVALHYWF